MRAEQQPIGRHPTRPCRGSLHIGRQVARGAACSVDDVHVARTDVLVAHEAADERDRTAVGRPDRPFDLHLRLQNRTRCAIRRVDDPQLRDVPVVVARAVSGGDRQPIAARTPVEVVHVQIRWRELTHLARGDVNDSKPLREDSLVDHAGRCRRGHHGPGRPRRVLNEKKRDRLPIRGPSDQVDLFSIFLQSVKRPPGQNSSPFC